MSRIVEIADGARLLEPELLVRCERLHRQLRPHLGDYVAVMEGVFADGAGMAAYLVGGEPTALAVWRAHRNTHMGRRFYVDDLVTDEAARSTGAGHAMVAWLEARARALGCPALDLDSATHRLRAHRFYFREHFAIQSFGFRKPLE